MARRRRDRASAQRGQAIRTCFPLKLRNSCSAGGRQVQSNDAGPIIVRQQTCVTSPVDQLSKSAVNIESGIFVS